VPNAADIVLRTPELEKSLLEYILQVTDSSENWWMSTIEGTVQSRLDWFKEFRARYEARRSVADLYRDAKDEPFPLSANVGVGVEQIFGEFLIPTSLANTYDLDPMLQAVDEQTEKENRPLTVFHDNYQRSQELGKRAMLERSIREILTVGGVFHKWAWSSIWKQQEVPVFVFAHPQFGPVMVPNPETGEQDFMYADPNMPSDHWPVGPDGVKLRIKKLPSSKMSLLREGPRLAIRPYEAMEFPAHETRIDCSEWDWLADNFTVSPFWFLGREGDPFEGGLQNLDKLWDFLKVDPNTVARNPTKRISEPVKLKEFHGKFPVTRSGRPVEIYALLAVEPKLLLGWRLSPFPRRPYFNRQVRTRKESPLGVGIPETVWSLRNALDATLNQDLDAGNLYNHPPLLLSSLAMMDDEDYEQVGPGTQWVLGSPDIRSAAGFLNPPISKRDPIASLNWLIGMTQRIWGVTDFTTGAPTESLSPNISTATGAAIVQSQGNVKFGHLTKRLSESDTQEYQMVHAMFRAMLANPRMVSVDGKPLEVKPSDREEFFAERFRIRAVGNGISTNPTIRQQVMMQYYPLISQDPLTAQDLEFRKEYLQRMLDNLGLEMTVKDGSEMQFMGLIRQLMQTPNGQQRLTQAVQISLQELQAAQAAQGGGQNGGTPGAVSQA